jgi:archaellum biogenesis protein FlaJ (TadC family)
VGLRPFTLIAGDVKSSLGVDAVLKAERAPGDTTCDVLFKRIERSNNWIDAFNILIFLVAAAAAAMLISAILSATNQNYVTTVVTGVGAVLASGAFTGLLKLRTSQQEEYDKYVQMRKEHDCP